MWRSTLLRTHHIARRWNSGAASLLRELESGKEVVQESIQAALQNQKLSDEEKAQLHGVIKNKHLKDDIINELLHFGLLQDFSLYHTVARARDLEWNNRSLASLLKANPGRSYTSSHLLKKHGNGKVSDEIRLVLIDKELNGDIRDDEEGAAPRTQKNYETASTLLSEIEDLESHLPALENFVDKMIEDQVFVFSLANNSHFVNVVNSRLDSVQDVASFSKLAQVVADYDKSLLSTRTITRLLQHSPDPELLSWIKDNKLDSDKTSPEALLIRIQLMDVYGMQLQDMKQALELFHHYQSHEKFGIELVQAKLSQAFFYKAVADEDETSVKVANALLNAEEVPVSSIAQQIIATSQFNMDDAIKIYNDFSSRVSKNKNEVTHRSPAGVLLEALVYGALSNNDRSLARFLLDKAEQHGVADESEMATVKKTLRVYGDSFAENETWEQAKPKFKQHVLEHVRQL